jgi:ABC-type multidrug transport system, ATPase component
MTESTNTTDCPSKKYMIRTEELTKVYKNGFKAVDCLNLEVEEGDIFGFLGPNGAGKTTTIRMLDGLLVPTSGRALIAEKDVSEHANEIKHLIGVVPESHGYYYAMTAREYLLYFSSLFDAKKEDHQYIDYLLDRVGLREKADVTVGQFSRGMKQRLGIAKALVNRPRVIFLDEPTLGLDPRGQYEIQQLLLEINHTDKITIFITSHLLKDIEVLCNKVSIVKNGILIEQGSIPELQQKYMTHYTMVINTNDNKKAMPLLSSLSSVRRITEDDEQQLVVKLIKGLNNNQVNEAKHDIMNTMLSADIDIEEMTHKTLSMEDIFFRATETEE